MSPIEIFWLIIIGTIVIVILVGFLLGVVIVNQRKFIGVQKAKLEDSSRLQEVLRAMPKQIVKAQEEERKRVSRDLHDGINQMLASILYRIHTIKKIFGTEDRSFQISMDSLSNDLGRTIDEVKRISHNLRPNILDELGVHAALRNLCDELASHGHIEVHYDLNNLPHKLPHEIELGIFRIIQEAFRNIGKHASATKVTLEVKRTNSHLDVVIRDNGKGIDIASFDHTTAGKQAGLGLITMKERAILLGGHIDITPISSDEGGGTSITLRMPFQNGNEYIKKE